MVADEFEYNKSSNILKARGNIEIFDQINLYEIYTDKVIYLKMKIKYSLKEIKSDKRWRNYYK